MSTPTGDDGREEATTLAAAPTQGDSRPRNGRIAGFVTTVALTVLLLSFQGDEGDILSAPVWWTFIAIAAAALLITAAALVSSTAWRRFGVGFAVGAIVALPVEAVILVLLAALTWSE
jgi:hypothetical protein